MLLLIRHIEPDDGRQYCNYFGSGQTPAVRNTLLDVTEAHYTKVLTSADK